MSSERVLELAEEGKKAGCSEALITLGEMPETHGMMREKLDDWGYSNTVDYLSDLCKQILRLGLLPHTNPGIIGDDELIQLQQWNASMGLMLECVVKLSAHEKSPGKDPKLRLEMIEAAGELKIPFTTGLLIGIGESWEDRVKSLLKIREIHKKYGHIQEIIIQPFAPKSGTQMENIAPPTHSELLSTVMTARSMMPDMNIQVPPNLVSRLSDFLQMGVNDLGGISTVTPDFINPEDSWPKIQDLEKALGMSGFKLRERLPIYPQFAKDEEFMATGVRELVDELADEEGYRRNRK